jgi:hypothetical protein
MKIMLAMLIVLLSTAAMADTQKDTEKFTETLSSQYDTHLHLIRRQIVVADRKLSHI